MRKLTAAALLSFCCMLQSSVRGQGLFEGAGEEISAGGAAKERTMPFSLSGYLKGYFFGGQNSNDDAVISAANAQLSLKLDARISGLADLFSEVRLNAGKLHGSSSASFDIREAWVALSPGPLNIKAGRQIISWGRADAVNPTNNITPRDETVLSSEFDDTRSGNELLQLKAKTGTLSVQGIWIPYYRPDVLPLTGAQLPSSITIGEPDYPDMRFKNGGYALRLEATWSSIDGSLSYFNGYPTLPGFDFSPGQTGLSLIPRAYRIHAIGADFSTSAGSFGLRGEAAVKYPIDDYKDRVYIPNPFAQYVLGLDRTIGDWSAILQYSGLYVLEYEKIPEPVLADPSDQMSQLLYNYAVSSSEIRKINRLFTGTSDRVSHSITGNIQRSILHETLHLKLAGMYNFTTGDYAVNPSVSYDIADAVNLAVGGRYIDGPEEKLNHLISNLMSFVYTELKVSF